jgi:protein-tyrosine phosphatase
MGYNRSGMVAALILVAMGYTPKEAIRLVRRARGSFALSNKSFAEFVRFGGERLRREALQ